VSAMGDMFLVLEEAADALGAIDPEAAMKFRVVNGLPADPRSAMPADPAGPANKSIVIDAGGAPPEHHEIRMVVGDDQIRSECTCGTWTCVVDWDEMSDMVVRIRDHVGHAPASSGDGITPAPPATIPLRLERSAG